MAYSEHLLGIAVRDVSRLDEVLDDVDFPVNYAYALVPVSLRRFLCVLEGFLEGSNGLVVVAILVDLDLRAGVEEPNRQ